jgi:hypothetical protein
MRRQGAQLEIAHQRSMLIDRLKSATAGMQQGSPVSAQLGEQCCGQPPRRAGKTRATMPGPRRLLEALLGKVDPAHRLSYSAVQQLCDGQVRCAFAL